MSDAQNSDDFSGVRISDAEWDNRRLCDDGNCIGVIGPDGRCKECGRSTSGEPPATDDVIDDSQSTDSDAPETIEAPLGDHENSADDAWENRRLCPDGNCIGVIGPDGRCKECGRPDEES